MSAERSREVSVGEGAAQPAGGAAAPATAAIVAQPRRRKRPGPPPKALDDRMLDAAAMLASGATRRQVAEHFGIPNRTIHHWCSRPDFQRHAALDRKVIVRVALEELAAASRRAVAVLVVIAEDGEAPAAARVSAANSILDRVLPPPIHEGVIVDEPPRTSGFDALSDDELATLQALLSKAGQRTNG